MESPSKPVVTPPGGSTPGEEIAPSELPTPDLLEEPVTPAQAAAVSAVQNADEGAAPKFKSPLLQQMMNKKKFGSSNLDTGSKTPDDDGSKTPDESLSDQEMEPSDQLASTQPDFEAEDKTESLIDVTQEKVEEAAKSIVDTAMLSASDALEQAESPRQNGDSDATKEEPTQESAILDTSCSDNKAENSSVVSLEQIDLLTNTNTHGVTDVQQTVLDSSIQDSALISTSDKTVLSSSDSKELTNEEEKDIDTAASRGEQAHIEAVTDSSISNKDRILNVHNESPVETGNLLDLEGTSTAPTLNGFTQDVDMKDSNAERG